MNLYQKRTIAFQPFAPATLFPQMHNPISRKCNIERCSDLQKVFREFFDEFTYIPRKPNIAIASELMCLNYFLTTDCFWLH